MLKRLVFPEFSIIREIKRKLDFSLITTTTLRSVFFKIIFQLGADTHSKSKKKKAFYNKYLVQYTPRGGHDKRQEESAFLIDTFIMK